MAGGSYTYNPEKICENGKDKMRFELGDTMVEGAAETSALTDEEISAALEMWPGRWKRAKLSLLESICRRFAYEPDTKTGPLTFSFGDRAKLWREDYEKLKKEVENSEIQIPSLCSTPYGKRKRPYFYLGMMGNKRSKND